PRSQAHAIVQAQRLRPVRRPRTPTPSHGARLGAQGRVHRRQAPASLKGGSRMTTRHYVYLAGLALLALVLASCAGIDLGDLVKVKTPNAIQQTTGLRSTLTLNEAEVEYQNWFNQVQATG